MEAWLEQCADAAGSGGSCWRSQECSALMQSLVVVLQTVCSLSRKNQAWKEVAGPPQLLDCITLHSRAWTCLYICGQNVCKLDVCFFSLPCGLWLAGQGDHQGSDCHGCLGASGPGPSQRYGPSGSGQAGTRIVRCSPNKPMLLISSSHEKQTAIKQRASRDREFLYQLITMRK